jgi:hypothetical protein
MDQAAAASLKALSLATIGQDLQVLAATWAKLCIDHLPTGDKTLASLQEDYRELFESFPISEPAEIEPLLRRYARAMRLKGERVTVTQDRFLTQVMTRRDFQRLAHYDSLVITASDAFDYIEAISDRAGLSDLRFSKAMAIYVISHSMLGAGFPTFTEEFRAYLCSRLAHGLVATPENVLTLDKIIGEHSRWIAQTVHESKGVSADWPVVMDTAEYEAAEVAGYWMDEDLDEEEAAMTVRRRGHGITELD